MSNFTISEANYSRSRKMFSFLLTVPSLSELRSSTSFDSTKMYHFALVGRQNNPVLICVVYHGDSNILQDVSSEKEADDKLFIIDNFNSNKGIENTNIVGIPVVLIHEEQVNFRNSNNLSMLASYVKNNFSPWSPTNIGYNLGNFINFLKTEFKDNLQERHIENVSEFEPKTVVHGGVLKPGQ